MRISKSIVTSTSDRAINFMSPRNDGIIELVVDEIGSTKSGELPMITKGTKQRKTIVVQRNLYNQCKDICNSSNPSTLIEYEKVMSKVISRLK